MILSAHNWITDLDPELGVVAPTPSTGYETAALWQGGIARAFRSSASTTIFGFDFLLTANRPVGLAAVFGLRVGAGSITKVEVRRLATWPRGIGVGTLVGTIELNERGDGALYLPVPIADETWYFEVQTSAPGQITVGELWLGEAVALPRAYATRQDQIDYHVIENVSDAQTVRATEIADFTRRFRLGFDRLTGLERDALLAAWRAARGSARDVVVLLEDGDESGPIFGRLQASMTWQVDYPVNTGLALDLVEGGRMLGA